MASESVLIGGKSLKEMSEEVDTLNIHSQELRDTVINSESEGQNV